MRDRLNFHPILNVWFERKFRGSTDVQRQAWEAIVRGDHALIAAPTGSGKTLAALMPLLDKVLWEKMEAGSEYGRGVRVLYVTPLKALNNDIHQHLFDYMDEIALVAEELGYSWPGIAVGVRTGDTTQSTRASMLRRPPDVLVTTPESLYILLTTKKASAILRSIRFVVVDEIHNLAGGERGMHLSVTLERLGVLCGEQPQRIGVSATVKPPERIARFMGGWAGEPLAPRPVTIVESKMDRRIDLQVTMPQITSIRNKKEDVWTPLIEEILRHLEGASGAIIFTNNRRMCERLTSRLNNAVGEDFSRSHHGSVARERRLETERMLRSGELRCLVATSSLELGIDVGYVDLVLQIDSPLSAASGIQRIGRAGHAVGGVSRGVIIARHRGALPEIAVLAERIAMRDTDEIVVPRYGAGVLAQQIVALVAAWERCTPDEVYALIQRSDCYNGFSRDRFDALVAMMSGHYAFVRPHIEMDEETGELVSKAGSGMAAIMGAGTIPQSTGYPVYHAEERIHLGELDEEYIFESRVGDVFQLGTSTWRIRSIREDRVEVVETNSAFGEIPFWRADGVGRPLALSVEIGEAMEKLLAMLPELDMESVASERAVALLVEQSRFSPVAAESLISLLKSQRAVSSWPTHKRIVMEWFTDDSKLTHVVIHSWFGRKFNVTWMIALQHYLAKNIPVTFETTVKDNGLEFIFREWNPVWLEVVQGVSSESIESLLLEAVPTSPLFASVFRNIAETSLLFSRSFRRVPGWLKRLRGQELLRDALALGTEFPLVREALRECLEQSLDLPHVKEVLRGLESGAIEMKVIHTGVPSPLATQFFYEYLNRVIYESDSIARELQQRISSVSKELAIEVFGEAAQTDTDVAGSQDDSLEEGQTHLESNIAPARWKRADPDRYCAILMRNHRLASEGKLRGIDGVREVLDHLQGIYLPLSWWETVVLPARIVGYRPDDLDMLCASGEFLWLGRKDDGAKEGKVAFFRHDAVPLYEPFMKGRADLDDCTESHQALYDRLKERGASFLTGLCADLGGQPSEWMPKLIDLVWSGHVANDQFAPLRLHGKGVAASDRAKFRSGLGRWYIVESLASVLSKPNIPSEKSVFAWANQLLKLNGIATRYIASEQSPYDWDTLSTAYERMEDWGMVTRGLLVEGIRALQFADKKTAELLRLPGWSELNSGVVLLSSADPANPYGISVEWPESDNKIAYARKPGNYLLFWQGRWLAWVENRGRRWSVVGNSDADESVLSQCIRQAAIKLLREQNMRKLVIDTWNGEPVGDTPVGRLLSGIGAEKDRDSYVIWPSAL